MNGAKMFLKYCFLFYCVGYSSVMQAQNLKLPDNESSANQKIAKLGAPASSPTAEKILLYHWGTRSSNDRILSTLDSSGAMTVGTEKYLYDVYKSTGNEFMAGSGLYVSTSPLDTMTYGSDLIVLEISSKFIKDVEIISDTVPFKNRSDDAFKSGTQAKLPDIFLYSVEFSSSEPWGVISHKLSQSAGLYKIRRVNYNHLNLFTKKLKSLNNLYASIQDTLGSLYPEKKILSSPMTSMVLEKEPKELLFRALRGELLRKMINDKITVRLEQSDLAEGNSTGSMSNPNDGKPVFRIHTELESLLSTLLMLHKEVELSFGAVQSIFMKLSQFITNRPMNSKELNAFVTVFESPAMQKRLSGLFVKTFLKAVKLDSVDLQMKLKLLTSIKGSIPLKEMARLQKEAEALSGEVTVEYGQALPLLQGLEELFGSKWFEKNSTKVIASLALDTTMATVLKIDKNLLNWSLLKSNEVIKSVLSFVLKMPVIGSAEWFLELLEYVRRTKAPEQAVFKSKLIEFLGSLESLRLITANNVIVKSFSEVIISEKMPVEMKSFLEISKEYPVLLPHLYFAMITSAPFMIASNKSVESQKPFWDLYEDLRQQVNRLTRSDQIRIYRSLALFALNNSGGLGSDPSDSWGGAGSTQVLELTTEQLQGLGRSLWPVPRLNSVTDRFLNLFFSHQLNDVSDSAQLDRVLLAWEHFPTCLSLKECSNINFAKMLETLELIQGYSFSRINSNSIDPLGGSSTKQKSKIVSWSKKIDFSIWNFFSYEVRNELLSVFDIHPESGGYLITLKQREKLPAELTKFLNNQGSTKTSPDSWGGWGNAGGGEMGDEVSVEPYKMLEAILKLADEQTEAIRKASLVLYWMNKTKIFESQNEKLALFIAGKILTISGYSLPIGMELDLDFKTKDEVYFLLRQALQSSRILKVLLSDSEKSGASREKELSSAFENVKFLKILNHKPENFRALKDWVLHLEGSKTIDSVLLPDPKGKAEKSADAKSTVDLNSQGSCSASFR